MDCTLANAMCFWRASGYHVRLGGIMFYSMQWRIACLSDAVITSQARMQATAALSSGEAELDAIGSGFVYTEHILVELLPTHCGRHDLFHVACCKVSLLCL